MGWLALLILEKGQCESLITGIGTEDLTPTSFLFPYLNNILMLNLGVHRHFETQMFMGKTEFRTLKVLFALCFMCSVQILYAVNFDVEGIYYNGNESSKSATVLGSYNDVVYIPEKVAGWTKSRMKSL